MTTTPASRIAVAAGTLIALGLLAGCTSGGTAQPAATSAPMATGSASPATTPASSPAMTTGAADAATLAVKMADSTLGSILVDGKGIIRWKHVGPLTDAVIADELMPALQQVEAAR